MHLEAAVEAGKNIFTEKPVGRRRPGIRKVLDAAEEAKKKNLAIVAGTQRRHQAGYIETMKRIHDGAIGDVVAARVLLERRRHLGQRRGKPGDDRTSSTRSATGTTSPGSAATTSSSSTSTTSTWSTGRSSATRSGRSAWAAGATGRHGDPNEVGHIFDHFAVDYEYPNGVQLSRASAGRSPGAENNVSETVVGTKGTCPRPTGYHDRQASKVVPAATRPNPYVQEHIDLIESIRAGKPLNELKQVAESTLTAIMGRMSAYTGKTLTWDEVLHGDQVVRGHDAEAPDAGHADPADRAGPVVGQWRPKVQKG